MFKTVTFKSFLFAIWAIILTNIFLHQFGNFTISNAFFISIILVAGIILLFRTIRKKMMSRRIISSGIKGKKTAALTFDDGPYSPYTEQILDLLKEKNVKATFFVLGYHAERNPEIIKRIVSEGHQLGNHSYTHLNFKKITREKVIEEINTTNKILFEITGQNIKIMRPPYGGKNLNVLDTIENLGFKVVLWSAAGQDWANHGVNKTVEKTLREFKDGGIILLHDGDSLEPKEPREQTIEITKTLIDRLTAEGYSFLTIDELLALN